MGPLNCLNSTSQVKELTWDTFKNRCKLKSLPSRDKAVVPQILLVSKLSVFQYVKEFTYVLHNMHSPLFSPFPSHFVHLLLILFPFPPGPLSPFPLPLSFSLFSPHFPFLFFLSLSPLPHLTLSLPSTHPPPPSPPEWHSTLCGSACAPGLSLPVASAAYN